VQERCELEKVGCALLLLHLRSIIGVSHLSQTLSVGDTISLSGVLSALSIPGSSLKEYAERGRYLLSLSLE
jgi:hypothetical protein